MRKTLLVTGATRGIGKAIVQGLMHDFENIVVHYGRAQAEAEALCAELSVGAPECECVAIGADIADEQQVVELFNQAEQRFGGLDAVVQNAGVNSQGLAAVTDLSIEEYDRLHRINHRGAFLVMREAARRVRDRGRILAMATTINRIHSPGFSGYAMSKGGVDHLVPILAKELAERGVTVNAVAPSAVDTALFREGKSSQQIESIANAQPMGRIGLPEDIVPAIRFLLSEEAGWVSGQILGANGALA